MLLLACAAPPAADSPAGTAGSGIYKCRSKDGTMAFVSKIDASVHDCVEIVNQGASSANAGVAVAPTPTSTPGDAARSSRTAESDNQHAARVKDMLATVTQWCADNQAPGLKPRDRDKAQSACVIDKMGTYKLLYP